VRSANAEAVADQVIPLQLVIDQIQRRHGLLATPLRSRIVGLDPPPDQRA
jgi:hypothetical protein